MRRTLFASAAVLGLFAGSAAQAQQLWSRTIQDWTVYAVRDDDGEVMCGMHTREAGRKVGVVIISGDIHVLVDSVRDPLVPGPVMHVTVNKLVFTTQPTVSVQSNQNGLAIAGEIDSAQRIAGLSFIAAFALSRESSIRVDATEISFSTRGIIQSLPAMNDCLSIQLQSLTSRR